MRRYTAALALGATLALSLPGAFASPVPADERSLLAGSDLYVLHCAECHGWAPMQRYNARFQDDDIIEEFDFSSLVEEEYGESAEAGGKTVYIEDDDAWPEWAEFPDPGDRANDPDERLLIMEEMTRAIDDHYGTGEQDEVVPDVVEEDPDLATDALENYVIDDGRTPGAADLLRPELFLYGSGEYELFRVIAEGNGVLMPGFRDRLDSEEAIWNLVNFLRSLWPQQDFYDY